MHEQPLTADETALRIRCYELALGCLRGVPDSSAVMEAAKGIHEWVTGASNKQPPALKAA